MRAPLAALTVVLGTLVLGMWLGGHNDMLPAPLRDFVTDDDTELVEAAMDKIADDYYRELSKEELADNAVRGMVEGLDDRFSAYFDEKEYRRFKEVSDAKFSGVGLAIQRHKHGLRVVTVYDDSPAKRGGLRVGDIIVKADGKELAGKPEASATGLIKGEPGTKVTLTVRRDGREFDKRLTRAEVSIPVVSDRFRSRQGKDFAVIRLETFSSGAHAEVYDAVRKARKRKVDGIVFDLRGNGGGLVEEARLVASAFLEDGEIVTTKGRSVPTRVYRATGKPIDTKTPMVVLVDRGTASAAEIVAGALQDRDRAELVGTATFGKGVFQEVVELDGGGALDITVGQYFLPSGRNLGGKGTSRGSGLKPDVKAEDDQETRKVDEALERALSELAGSARP
jgi:carboxyl-terminal processing protease